MSTETKLDKAIPEVEIDFKDRKLKLLFDFWAMALFEEKTGLNGLEKNLLTQLNMRRFVTLLWAGAQIDDNPPSETEIGRWLTNERMISLSKVVMDALKKANSNEEDLPKKKAKAESKE